MVRPCCAALTPSNPDRGRRRQDLPHFAGAGATNRQRDRRQLPTARSAGRQLPTAISRSKGLAHGPAARIRRERHSLWRRARNRRVGESALVRSPLVSQGDLYELSSLGGRARRQADDNSDVYIRVLPANMESTVGKHRIPTVASAGDVAFQASRVIKETLIRQPRSAESKRRASRALSPPDSASGTQSTPNRGEALRMLTLWTKPA